MATLENRNGWYRLIFRYGGKKVCKSLRTQDSRKANVRLAQAERLLKRLRLGEAVVPDLLDPISFIAGESEPIASAGNSRQTLLQEQQLPASGVINTAWAFFLESIPNNSLEESTLKGMATHISHLIRILGAKKKLADISKPVLQEYVDSRSKESGRYGRNVSVQTIKKELRTFSTVWNWAKEGALVDSVFPNKRLRYPKYVEKPPFQTITQIRSKIKRFNLDEIKSRELWDSVFLSVEEVQSVLDFAKGNEKHRPFFPMLCFAAYTGARRSEILRSELEDIDFDSSVITIREKKRLRGRLSTRRVPLQEKLRIVLENWLSTHPGTEFTFAEFGLNESEPAQISNDQASHYFEITFKNTEWSILPGWHTFRHSFCSNCAAAGVDQRMINEWVGHQTDEMVRRYRHLFPNQQKKQIDKVFA